MCMGVVECLGGVVIDQCMYVILISFSQNVH